jgi:hypothetical protein
VRRWEIAERRRREGRAAPGDFGPAPRHFYDDKLEDRMAELRTLVQGLGL